MKESAQVAAPPTNAVRSRRLVQMTSVHGVFDVRIFHKECRSLALAGHDITLIAPTTGGSRTVDGVKVRAVALPGTRRDRMTKTLRAVYRAALRENAEVYHFHDPELIPVALALKLAGRKIVYDVHEDYSHNMDKGWIPKRLQPLISKLVQLSEWSVTLACDHVVAATPKIAEKFDRAKTTVVQNYPWLHEFAKLEGLPYAEREPLVAYVGYLAPARGTKEMAEAIHQVALKEQVRLIVAGAAIGGTQDAMLHTQPEIIEHLGIISRTEIASLLGRCRMGIVVYHPTPNYLHGQPTKLLEYMAAGLPVVASDFPFYRRVIRDANCGLLVDPLEPREIADAILWLLRNPRAAETMGANGRKAIEETYNWDRESQRLVNVYATL